VGLGAHSVVNERGASTTMRPRVTFEPMEVVHVPQVVEIERLASAAPWSAGLFLHELKVSFSRCRVACTANGTRAVLGYACWWVVADEAHILNLAVHPDHRRSGIGSALVGLVIDDARSNGAGTVSLEVRPDNVAAQGLYGRFQFSRAGVRRDYYAPGENAIIMTREL
jgi:ribosomal-protein-alanine N-acetyltransferase